MTSNLLEKVQIYLLPQADSRIRDIVLIFLVAVYIFKDGGRERVHFQLQNMACLFTFGGSNRGFMIFLHPFRSLIS